MISKAIVDLVIVGAEFPDERIDILKDDKTGWMKTTITDYDGKDQLFFGHQLKSGSYEFFGNKRRDIFVMDQDWEKGTFRDRIGGWDWEVLGFIEQDFEPVGEGTIDPTIGGRYDQI